MLRGHQYALRAGYPDRLSVQVTTLISWTGVDSHGPASLYLASDSRITWGTNDTWDLGRKVFATGTAPWIMGYCGDVVFPSLLLGQLSDLIDAGLLFRPTAGFDERTDALRVAVHDGLQAYPPDQRRDFSIVFGTRVGERTKARFHLIVTTWSRAEGWAQAQIAMPRSPPLVRYRAPAKATCKSSGRDAEEGNPIRTVAAALAPLGFDDVVSTPVSMPHLVDDRMPFLELSRKHTLLGHLSLGCRRVDAAATATVMSTTVVPVAPG